MFTGHAVGSHVDSMSLGVEEPIRNFLVGIERRDGIFFRLFSSSGWEFSPRDCYGNAICHTALGLTLNAKNSSTNRKASRTKSPLLLRLSTL